MELIMAMAAGLTVATAAMLLARNTSRFFQYEARFSSAHISAMLGMQRLTADIQRAAFLSTPNIREDPMTCRSSSTWPPGLQQLAGIRIIPNGSYNEHTADLAQSAANGLQPDSLIIGGAFGTNEQFDVQTITGNGTNVQLQLVSGAMKRTEMRASTGSASLPSIFAPGRILRIVTDGQPPYVYGVIAGYDAATRSVLLGSTPALPFKDVGPCGISSSGTNSGFIVSPVARVLYDIRSLRSHPTYGLLVEPPQNSEQMTGDLLRTELIRVELDANDEEIPSTLEVVSEYAVDLKFGISTAAIVTATGVNPEVQRFPIQTPALANIGTVAGDITSGGTPQRIRSVQVRLSTRTRAPDRDSERSYTAGAETRHLRFLIPGVVPSVAALGDTVPAGAPAVYARMRTLQAEVALPNNERAQQW
ncbi:Type IV fimbrial biogenesis protein PilW [Chondromyces apiculatus DSM 436]|uniref:Type IV fimbrial biogenesis protein PilW n=1 Tax=Chondromyces apiculatus DSM 436 TaxID=1192034 RepID=A0A017SY67_9BACT|nr:Type IV fimbrial biogenesis protein PilW [Chondromyces apiculatus DSM 436]